MITPRSIPTVDDVARHYDELDTFYREIWGDHLHHGYWEMGSESADEAVKALIELAARNANIKGDDRVCDVGCGYGATAAYLADRFGADVTGITLSKTQFTYAEERYASNKCRFVLGDWLENDFGDGAFGVVTGIECLSHMTDKRRFFEEAFRVLEPGGKLVLFTWLAGDRATDREIRWLLEPICREGRLPSMASMTDLVELGEAAGFVEIETEDLTSRVRRTWGICAKRLAAKLSTDGRYLRYLFDSSSSDRAFFGGIGRIWIACRTGAMSYGLFVASKPV